MPTTPAAVRRLAHAALASVALSGAAAGCQRSYAVEYEKLAAEPVVYDEAMALRDWRRTPAYYASGNVVAGPAGPNRDWRVGAANEPGYQTRSNLAIVVEPALYVVNTALLIPSVILDPPWEDREYEGRVLGPTYTAAVPLEAANVGSTYEGREVKERVLKDRAEQRSRAAATPQRTGRGGRPSASPPRHPVPTPPPPTTAPQSRPVWTPLEDLVPGTTRPGAAVP